MDIAEVARRAGVPASTLRYYEKAGLVASLGPPGARRQFAPEVLDQLALIALGQSAGLSLETVRWKKTATLQGPERCTGCSLCAWRCPFDAIDMREPGTGP